jgi:hypothetical protein
MKFVRIVIRAGRVCAVNVRAKEGENAVNVVGAV